MSIGNLSNNYEGELFAINLALDEIVSFQGMAKKVCILSDCRPALYQSFSNNIAKKYNNILNTIRGKLLNLHRKGTIIHGFWVPGHSNLPGNDLADKHAKIAADEKVKFKSTWDRSIIYSLLKCKVVENWQFRINHTLNYHMVFEINSSANKWFIPKEMPVVLIKHLLQLISGQHLLNSSQYYSNPNCSSPLCICGVKEDVFHFIYKCQRYTYCRFKYLQKVKFILKNSKINRLEDVSFKTLCGQRLDFNIATNSKLFKYTVEFIIDTKRFRH